MATLGMDLRFGGRMLLKNPGIAIVAVLMLAVGIGGNTAIFSIIDAVLLSPLPYKDAGRLVRLLDVQPGLDAAPHSYPEYLDWKDQAGVFESVSASFSTQVALTGEGEPESLSALRVSASLLPQLGLAPPLGRQFGPEEEGPQGERLVLISDGLWRRRYGADPKIIGRPLTLDGEAWTVAGVLPRGLRFQGETELYMPLRLDTERAPRGLHFITLVGRLKDGLTPERARADIEAISKRMQADKTTEHGFRFIGLREHVVGDTRTTLLLLLGALGCLLLIACANIASLLLSRAAARQKEVAVRLAIGASRWHVVRQFLIESALLSLAGAMLGVLLAWWGVDLFSALPDAGIPRLHEVRIDGRVLGFTLALSIVCALLFGLAPALQAVSTNLNDTLKDTGRNAGGGPGRQRLRNLLVVGEVSLSLMLLIGAGLLLKSFTSVLHVERGFDSGGVLTAEISLARRTYGEPQKEAAFFDQVLARIAALGGVEGAAITNSPPLGGNSTNGDVLIEGRATRPGEEMLSELRRVSADYFRVMRIPLVRGRGFTLHDRPEAPAVAIINQAFADRFFPGADPIGKRIDAQWETHGWQEVIGVVGNVKHWRLEKPTLAEIYLPFSQAPMGGMSLVVRTKGDPRGLQAAVRAQVYAVDPNQPVHDVRTMDEILAASVAARRLTATLLGGFAALALILAAIGLYGVLAFWVAQRWREIGIRMALGARRRDVLRLVVAHGMSLMGLGVALGLAGALAVTRLIAGLLFGVTSHDPAVLTGIPLLVAIVALFACYIPARRATRVDPMVALRTD